MGPQLAVVGVALALWATAYACAWPLWRGGQLQPAGWANPVTGACAMALACGALLAHRRNTLGAGTLAAGVGLAWLGMAIVAARVGALGDISAPAVRTLLLAPAPALLCGIFGASLPLLSPGRAGAFDGLELRLARRLLLSPTSGVLSQVTGISVIGVALGVWLVIVAMGILSGFEGDLVQKIVGANAHLVLSDVHGGPLPHAAAVAQRLEGDRDVRAATAVVEAEVAVAGKSQYAAGTLFGIDIERAPKVLDVLHTMVAGDLAHLARPCTPLCPVVLGIELARALGVGVGDPIRLISAVDEVLTPLGPAPKSLGLRVVGVFASKMYDYDSRYLFMDVQAARRFAGLPADSATAIQVRVTEPEAMDGVQARVQALAAQASGKTPIQALSWTARNQTLFSALALERVVAGVVLTFIILVASFSIVNTLTMSILERRHEIAILKTMGARDGTILRIFVGQGVLIGSLGLAMGVGLGVGTLAVLGRIPLGIPYEVYYLETLPVRISVADIVMVAMAASGIVWNFAVFPSLAGAALRPVEGLRDG